MSNPNDVNLTEVREQIISRGNVCVSNKGQLFVALNLFRMPQTGGLPTTWYGIGFNGQPLYAEKCVFIAATINEYLESTYGTSYAAEVSKAAEEGKQEQQTT